MALKETAAVLLLAAASALSGADDLPADLPRSRPETQGIPSAAILAFVDAAEEKIDALHSFMLLRHGHVVAEGWWSPYGPNDPQMLFSLSKSFTSTAVGLAVAEGRMTIDDLVLPYFPDEAPPDPSAHLKAMRVRDLLCMSSGHDKRVLGDMLKAAGDGKWTWAFLAAPVDHKPGTHFAYNSPASYMLSAIVQKATGTKVLDYLRPRLFEPLGIRNPAWGESPQGITLGGWGLSLKTEDLARFGQLYLQKGEWRGQRILPADWVAAATARQTSNGSDPTSDWEQGYGYQFWRCRDGLYRGDGAHGQFLIVMPEEEAVVAITGGLRDMPAVMNLVREHLLAPMKAAPLPADERAQESLRRRLEGLSLPPQSGKATSRLAARVSGRTYAFPANEQKIDAIAIEFGRDGTTAVLRKNGGAGLRTVFGRGAWRKGQTSFMDDTEQPAAASGAWTADDTYAAKLCLYETPFCLALGFRFTGDELVLDVEHNVGREPFKRPTLVGRAP